MWTFFIFVICCGVVHGQFIPSGYEEVTQATGGGFGAAEKCGEGELANRECVEYHRCDPNTNTTIPETEEPPEKEFDYSLLIDIRMGETNPCSPNFLQVCCKKADGSNPSPPTPIPPPSPTPSTEDTNGGVTSSPIPQPSLQSYCGIRNINGIDFKITGNTHNEAEYGEFPWMVAILKTNYDPSKDSSRAICGGSLIAPRVVLTATHCVHKLSAGDIHVRAGEWDTQTSNERYPYQERDVAEIIVHEGFKDGVLHNDVALIVLTKPFKKARHIGTICLPEKNEVINSHQCYATGWGKNLFGKEGEYQVILKKIELPIVDRKKCEADLKKTRLGNYFKLHNSFICAGGIEGKDTCTGDGGSPLVCPDPNNPSRYVQAGIVAWGIGCGTAVPGVYADVAKFREWVDKNMQRLNLSIKPYTV